MPKAKIVLRSLSRIGFSWPVFVALSLFAATIHFEAVPPDATAAGMDSTRLSQLPKRMQEFVKAGTASGFVTMVIRHGRVAEFDAVGFRDLETKSPMQKNTLFQIQSMTKPITCVGVMMLMEEGRLALIDPVEKYLPEFKDRHLGRPIQILDLMTHTAGLSGSMPKSFDKNEHSLADVVKTGIGQPLAFEPGAKWAYSNLGIATLGRIIEVVSGQPYEKFMQERIFDPVGMVDTHFFLPESKRDRLAMVYTDDGGTLRKATADPYRKGWVYPAPESGLYSTAADLARFYQTMLNGGALDGKRLLSPAAVRLMTTVHTGDLKAGFAPGMGYGLGWSVVKDPAGLFRLNSPGTYGHGGAYRTYGWIDPGKDLIGILLFQRTNGGGDVADEINAMHAIANAAVIQ